MPSEIDTIFSLKAAKRVMCRSLILVQGVEPCEPTHAARQSKQKSLLFVLTNAVHVIPKWNHVITQKRHHDPHIHKPETDP
ncbi:hypothetical protein KC19_VG005700 [Ceratodon purpureus]|uniref:Uncharacterized protein n=1 Tax=Ceratodon purpureus TaxID=3225 RepID=A0A8T0HKP8_CERPU|nr:hypothetical protein KC19_VG005700 [Ceratodon purpureus]